MDFCENLFLVGINSTVASLYKTKFVRKIDYSIKTKNSQNYKNQKPQNIMCSYSKSKIFHHENILNNLKSFC